LRKAAALFNQTLQPANVPLSSTLRSTVTEDGRPMGTLSPAGSGGEGRGEEALRQTFSCPIRLL
jgi:hypothetical protein